jgi:cytochrome oxidase assembly protein ShyY1
MRIQSGELLLVNRGWLPAPDGATADPRPFRQSGIQRVEGLLMEVPTIPEGATPSPIALSDTGFTTFQRLDLETVGVMLGHPPLGMYLQVAPAGSGREPF